MSYRYLVLWICSVTLTLPYSGGASKCSKDEYVCKNGACIDPSWKCDGEDDCGDGSDEEGCAPKVCDWLREFQCKNGRCIPSGWACDKSNDCGDGSDEEMHTGPMCPNVTTCPATDFQCRVSKKCIRRTFVCDGNLDCDPGDSSDEEDCSTHTCSSDEFRCQNGNCVSKSFVCDKHKDCNDGSDERNCSTAACKNTEFKCVASGHCIFAKYTCDGFTDCIDGSDERDCVKTTAKAVTVKKAVVKSSAFRLPTTVATTTVKAVTPLRCAANHVKCDNGSKCVHRAWLCDGEADCDSGEDESKERCAKVTCSPSEFTCGNGRCIPKNLRCDSTDHCGDGTDEKSCPTLRPVQCTQATYKCRGTANHCIPQSAVCNGNKDCPGGEDESSLCNVDECKTKTHGCSVHCRDLKIGYECYCDAGYQLLNDSRTCVDIDECQNPGVCSQQCVNLKGSFKCLCGSGYVLEPDHRHCRANAPLPILVFSNRFDIRQIGTSGQHYNELVKREHVRNAVALGVDVNNQHVYWADNIVGTISRARVNKAHLVEVVVVGHGGKLEGLAVDWVGQKLYWTTSHDAQDMIEVANLDGSFRTPLITTGLDQPRAIAVHPQKRVMFWTNMGGNPSIMTASMDGQQMKVVISSTHVGFPTGLAVDHTIERIFWVDSTRKYLGSSNFDGSDFKVVVARLNRPFGLTVFEDYVYWTNYRGKQMFRANKFTGGHLKEFDGNFFAPMDIHVYHPLSQKATSNPCQIRSAQNGGCSHLCLLSSVAKPGYSCMCPKNFVLQANMRDCVPVPKPTKKTCDGKTGSCSGCGKDEAWCEVLGKCISVNEICDGDPCSGKEGDGTCRDSPPNTKASTSKQKANMALIGGIVGTIIVLIFLIVISLYCLFRKRRNRFEHSIMYETENGLVAHGKTDKAPIIQFGQPMATLSHPVPLSLSHSPNTKNFDNINYIETITQDDMEDEGIQDEPSDDDTSNSSYDETKQIIPLR